MQWEPPGLLNVLGSVFVGKGASSIGSISIEVLWPLFVLELPIGIVKILVDPLPQFLDLNMAATYIGWSFFVLRLLFLLILLDQRIKIYIFHCLF